MTKKKAHAAPDDLVAAIRAVSEVPSSDAEIEGDRHGWHIRLTMRVEPHPGFVVETWTLYHKDTPESSPSPKRFALAFLAQEQAYTELTGNRKSLTNRC